MTRQLETIFGELGISQYLDVFVDQGFDTWETILDITESDLDALGVKLGHRRKLQRRIANSRGFAPSATLVSLIQPGLDDSRLDGHRSDAAKADNREPAKRKYRRHPKPDENAPERPPSAYVLFSNKMREDLKGRNLTFTEIAKLVGENWQNLSQTDKEPFETQAQTAKDKYSQDLTAYKKTPEFKKYMTYLQEFKAKHSGQTQEKDVSKRIKLSESESAMQSVLSNGITPASPTGGSDFQRGCEPAPSREHRISSVISASDSPHSTSVAAVDDLLQSPLASTVDRTSEVSPAGSVSPRDTSLSSSSRRSSSWADGPRSESAGSHPHLPSFSDMFDGRPLANGAGSAAERRAYGGFQRSLQNGSPASTPSLGSSSSRPPSLSKQYSSGASTTSSIGYPKTPLEGSLPIHALLLSGKPAPPFELGPIPSSRSLSPDRKYLPAQYLQDRPASDSHPNGMATNGLGYFASQPQVPSLPAYLPNGYGPRGQVKAEGYPQRASDGSSLDGIAALLKAKEIVDRQDGDMAG